MAEKKPVQYHADVIEHFRNTVLNTAAIIKAKPIAYNFTPNDDGATVLVELELDCRHEDMGKEEALRRAQTFHIAPPPYNDGRPGVDAVSEQEAQRVQDWMLERQVEYARAVQARLAIEFPRSFAPPEALE